MKTREPMPPEFRLLILGTTPYAEALQLQARLAAAVAAGDHPPTLLLLEHPHVYTFGRRGRRQHLLWDEALRQRRGVEVHWTDRGGDVTYHGPGQLVGYPILPLGRPDASSRLPRADYVGFLRRLEQTLIVALARLGLAAGQRPGLTGVWVQPDVASRCLRCPPAARRRPAKVAAIGVRIDAAGVSRHGFALNVAPDMTYFEGILACGLADDPVVSLEQLLDPPPSLDRVTSEVAASFAEVFGVALTADRIPAV